MDKISNYLFTVYDEQAPSVLKLLSRLHGTLNKLCNDFNQLDKVDAVRKGYTTVWPSSHADGYDDWLAIQTALDTTGTVHLVEGDYYVSKSLTLKTGNQLIGKGAKTRIYSVNPATPVICGHQSGFDHITIKDIHLVSRDRVATAIDLTGNDKEPYNGARYSLIDGVRISDFDWGVVMRGAWSTTLRRVRTINCEIGLHGLGCLNNLTFDSCEFTHGDIGVQLVCAGSTEMYGIRLNDTNLEGNAIGVYAEGVTGLAMINCYSEATPQVFNVNSCPMFTVDGGRFSGVTLFGTVTSTAYTTDKFTNPKCRIENANIEATGMRADLVFIDAGVKNAVVRNNRIICPQANDTHMLSSFAPVEHREVYTNYTSEAIRYSNDFEKFFTPDYLSNESAIVDGFTMSLMGTLVLSKAVTYTLFVEQNGTMTKIGQTGTLAVGTHNFGAELTTTFSAKPIINGPFTLKLVPSVDVGSAPVFAVSVRYRVADAGNAE